jgi:hypothetical protein
LTAEGRTIIGSTTHCVDPSCTGWLVDSFLGKKYWIQCLDKKHSIDKNQVENRKAGSFGGETSEPAEYGWPTQQQSSSREEVIA